MTYPSYIGLCESGELQRRVERAREMLIECRMCPRECGVDRFAGAKTGTCGLGASAEVASASPHFGEESPLVGQGGSGTIFFSSCNLRCVFCQNYDISQEFRGRETTPKKLAKTMLQLQEQGCHNINFVTPSHQVAAILEALVVAVDGGLNVPIVYNSSGYDAVETIELLDGVVDIYMPDIKTLDAGHAKRYLRAPDYPEVVRAAFREMHRQVGDLELDGRGLAIRGLLVRHLVMPDDIATTREVLRFLHDDISPNTYLNIMAQYHPAGETSRHPVIDRPITGQEHQQALDLAEELGMHRLDERRPKFFLRWL